VSERPSNEIRCRKECFDESISWLECLAIQHDWFTLDTQLPCYIANPLVRGATCGNAADCCHGAASGSSAPGLLIRSARMNAGRFKARPDGCAANPGSWCGISRLRVAVESAIAVSQRGLFSCALYATW
jgi:hypothetical protein